MAFLKLGDLIDWGHPVTVGYDGTVFTRLNIGQLADSTQKVLTPQETCADEPSEEILSDSSVIVGDSDTVFTSLNVSQLTDSTHQVISPQETCVDEQSEEFLSDSSCTLGLLANKGEFTVIDFEDLVSAYQKDDCQQGFSYEECGTGNVIIGNTSSETSLQVSEVTESEQCQYQSEELSTAELQALVELDDSVFFSGQPLKIANLTDDECGKENASDTTLYSDSTGEPYPECSRVLFDIGNLGVGHVPSHPGFIKLTTPIDAIPETHDECEEETSHSTNTQEGKIEYPASVSSSDSLVSCKMLMDLEPINKTGIGEEESCDPGSEASIPTENDDPDSGASIPNKNVREPTKFKLKTRPLTQKCPNPDCNEVFPSPSEAKRHCSIVHGNNKPFLCTFPDCGTAFPFASYLSRHVQAKHEGVRNHQCLECDRRFVTARDLTVHERTHTGERPVRCRQPDCKHTFSARSIADKHYLTTHTKFKPFQCKECGKSFGLLSNLIDHGLVHSGIRKFVCAVNGCGKAFSTNGKLKRHGLTHFPKQFGCKECDCSFRQHPALKAHVNKKHPG